MYSNFWGISRETFLGQAGQGLSENVERVRRAHQNDIENILPFLILGFLYMFTNPAYSTALLCYRCVFLHSFKHLLISHFVFRIFVGARIFHTIVYLLIVPQPSRALAWFAGIFVNIYMAYKIITTFM